MTITDQVEELQKQACLRSEDQAFAEILQEIDELKQEGILKKSTYSFPMLDTFGRCLVHSRHSS